MDAYVGSDTMFLRNTGTHLSCYVMAHPRRLQSQLVFLLKCVCFMRIYLILLAHMRPQICFEFQTSNVNGVHEIPDMTLNALRPAYLLEVRVQSCAGCRMNMTTASLEMAGIWISTERGRDEKGQNMTYILVFTYLCTVYWDCCSL
jgi:hypothetical protein